MRPACLSGTALRGRVFRSAALPGLLGLPHVQGQGIDQMNLVAALGQGDRVGARPAAHIQHPGGRRREQPAEQFQ